MKTIIQFILVFLTINSNVIAQKRGNIWCFGDSSLINFNTQPPTTGSSAIRTRGTACSISDTAGNLLFYCGAPHLDIWLAGGGIYFFGYVLNKNGDIMENGDTLAGELWYHEMVICPDPGNASRYYLFHVQSGAPISGLYYSVIDMSYNGGLGKVISKNNLLMAGTMASGITAVNHGNGRDWWIIARNYLASSGGPGNNDFYVFSLNPSGISPLQVQNSGSINTTDGISMSFNYTGEKFAFVNWRGMIEVHDFNRCSGRIISSVNIEPESTTNYPYMWGAAFSPSGQYLYVSQSIPDNYIFQYDLNATNIPASKKIIYENHQIRNGGGALQLAPDGKIYYSFAWNDSVNWNFPYPDTVYNDTNMYLGVINQPDLGDTLCDFQPFSFYLGGKRTYWGLPNNPDYDLGPLAGSICDTLNIGVDELQTGDYSFQIFPNPSHGTVNFFVESETGELIIYDAAGRKLKSVIINNKYATITALEAGIYSAEVIEKEKRLKLRKFIVIN